MICNVYNPLLFRFNNIFIPFNYFRCFFRVLYLFCFFFKSWNSRISSMIIESNDNFFTSSLDWRFVFLLSTEPFHIYKQEINTLVPNLKQKYLSTLIFCKFKSNKITSSTAIPSFSHYSYKVLSINSFVSGNILLTAFKTAETIFSRFLSILTTRA